MISLIYRVTIEINTDADRVRLDLDAGVPETIAPFQPPLENSSDADPHPQATLWWVAKSAPRQTALEQFG